jgi:hypothetical protein
MLTCDQNFVMASTSEVSGEIVCGLREALPNAWA